MILQVLGIIGMATLMFICVLLCMPRNTHIFVVVGQDVFKWMSLVLLTFVVTRVMAVLNATDTETLRNINSIVFLVVVAGIVWSVLRHVTTNKR